MALSSKLRLSAGAFGNTPLQGLRFLVLVAVVFFSLSENEVQSQGIAGEKKLIYYGWGNRDTKYVAEKSREMEQMPFDGIGVIVAIDRGKPTTGNGATVNFLGSNIFGQVAFRTEDFQPAISDLKGVRWQKFTDNFLPAAINTSEQDRGFTWFDDARWKTILNNWKVLVTISKESGSKGVILDPESYGAAFFDYRQMRKRLNKPYWEFGKKVRQRGQEMMDLTARIFPDVTILCLYGYSVAWHEVYGWGGLRQVKPLEEALYGLYPAFLDGMLEAAKPHAVIVDGYESAYGFKHESEFERARDEMKRKVIQLSSVPRLYEKHVQAGFGLWMDNDYKWNPIDMTRNYFTPSQFEQTVKAALKVSDRYVWIYSQAPRFFPPSDLPEVYVRAINAARLGN